MDDIKVFIANLGKYNEGKIVGAWFTPPINNEEFTEKLGLNDQYEEYMVQDYEGPVVFSEYSTIGEINEAAAAIEALKGTEIYPAIKELIGEWYDNVIELAAHKDDIACYHVANMTELAEELADEAGSATFRHKSKTISIMPRSDVTSKLKEVSLKHLMASTNY